MQLEEINLTIPAARLIVQECGYDPALPAPKKGTEAHTAAVKELQDAGLMTSDGQETDRAHEYVEHILFIADACERHG